MAHGAIHPLGRGWQREASHKPELHWAGRVHASPFARGAWQTPSQKPTSQLPSFAQGSSSAAVG
jgi:hypothetical protein